MPRVTNERIEEIRQFWTNAIVNNRQTKEDILTLLQCIDERNRAIGLAATELEAGAILIRALDGSLRVAEEIIVELREKLARKRAYYMERNAMNEKGIDNEGRRI